MAGNLDLGDLGNGIDPLRDAVQVHPGERRAV